MPAIGSEQGRQRVTVKHDQPTPNRGRKSPERSRLIGSLSQRRWNHVEQLRISCGNWGQLSIFVFIMQQFQGA
jgi:hypothetical protein